MSLLIKNVLVNGKKQSILVEGNKIESIGADTYKAEEIINGDGMAALPGLVNCHTHAAMALLRSYADDMTLQDWLQNKIWPAESKLTKEIVYKGTKLACLEMIKSGTTCFNDMYFYSEQIAKAAKDTGMRAVISEAVIDIFKSDMITSSEHGIQQKMELLKDFGELITPALAPHSIYTVSLEKLRWIAKYSAKNDLLVHTHLSETEFENSECIKNNGITPTRLLDDVGLLNPRLLAAHSVWISKEDAELMSRRHVKIVHNPIANMKLSVGNAFNYKMLSQSGCHICLGTDGAASNNNLDMFDTLKFAALLQKHHYNDPTAMNAKEVFALATEKGAEALRINAGKLEEGRLADIILINLKHPKMVPNHNLISSLVYSAKGDCVNTTIINGKLVMHDRVVLEEERIIEEAQEAAKELV